MTQLLQQVVINLGLRIVFGRQPDWRSKEEVRQFLLRNKGIITWLVDKTQVNIVAQFAELYSQILNNAVLFDLFYVTAAKIWLDPNSIIEPNKVIDNDPVIRQRLLDRIQDRIRARRKVGSFTITEDIEATKPESITAVLTVVTAISNIASVVVAIRRFRKR